MKSNPKYAYITVAFSLIDGDPNITALCDNALRKGVTSKYQGESAIYPVEPQYIAPDIANYVISVGGSVENYGIVRYTPVTDLTTDLPASLPSSTITEGDEGDEGGGVTRQLTWQEVFDRPTVNPPLVDGVYHFNCLSHLGHRPLTLDEYNVVNASGLTLIEGKDVPVPSTTDPIV